MKRARKSRCPLCRCIAFQTRSKRVSNHLNTRLRIKCEAVGTPWEIAVKAVQLIDIVKQNTNQQGVA